MACLLTPPFTLQDITAIFAALTLLDYNTWGMLGVEGNAMAHPDVGSMK